MVSKQLREEDFRFIKIRYKTKFPCEKDWPRTNNYRFDHPTLIAWLRTGQNIGICGGYGDLCIIDCDSKRLGLVLKKLKTFIVQTGSGGLHYYIKCKLDSSYAINDKNGEHLGDLISWGKQAVTVPSVHPSGVRYKVFLDDPIAELSFEELKKLLGRYVKFEADKPAPIKFNGATTTRFDIMRVCNGMSLRREIDGQYFGEHPVHGCSKTHKSKGVHICRNFGVSPSKNYWCCYACNTGGGVASLIAMLEGWVNCSDCRKGSRLPFDIYKKAVASYVLKHG